MQIGLDLVARHSEQVSILVAHEPPAFELLPEEERNRAMQLQEAAKLNEKVVTFPGGHTAWLLRPKAFAAKLVDVLNDRQR